MSVTAMNALMNPYFSNAKTLPHDVATKLIESAKDGGAVTSGESRLLFSALARGNDKFETASDKAALAKAATDAADTSAEFNALSLSEKKRVTNSVFDTTNVSGARKVGPYTTTAAAPMPRNQKYTDALVSLGFPLKAAQESAKQLIGFLRNEPDAPVVARVQKLFGKVVATEIHAGSGDVSLTFRSSPTGDQYLRYTPWID